MRQSESIVEISKALAAFQAKMARVSPEHFADAGKAKYHYAELADIVDQAKALLSEYGLVVVQPPRLEGNVVHVETVVIHKDSGQWMSGEVGIPVSPNGDARAHGSAITYARRYGFCSMLGIVVGEDDDDGKRASEKDNEDTHMHAWQRSQALINRCQNEVNACKTQEEVLTWYDRNKSEVVGFDPDTIATIKAMLSAKKQSLNLPDPDPVPPKAPASKPADIPKPKPVPSQAPAPTQAPVQQAGKAEPKSEPKSEPKPEPKHETSKEIPPPPPVDGDDWGGLWSGGK